VVKRFTATWKAWAQRLKVDAYTLYLVMRHPGVPWYARLLAAAVAGYAFSPIDLIPDFIPVLGYLDDLLIVPAGVYLALKLVPRPVLEECRQQARLAMAQGKPVSRVAAAVIIVIWAVLILVAIYFLVQFYHKK
jgi:uncharacterized membrane protein YkvA (DUF1232 family)